MPTPVPPTAAWKHRVIASYGSGLETFVETGTFRGDTVEAMRGRFPSVVSIELAPALAKAARQRFANVPNVRIVEGDSGTVLPTILPSKRTLFWLDGHWCGGDTALGAAETPLLAELTAVLGRRQRDVILVDDARLLGRRGYPSLDTIRGLVEHAVPRRHLTVADDILRIVPME